MSDKTEAPKLSEALKDKFTLAPGAGVGEYHFKRFQLNLETITLAQAEKVVAAGFPFLVPVVAQGKNTEVSKKP